MYRLIIIISCLHSNRCTCKNFTNLAIYQSNLTVNLQVSQNLANCEVIIATEISCKKITTTTKFPLYSPFVIWTAFFNFSQDIERYWNIPFPRTQPSAIIYKIHRFPGGVFIKHPKLILTKICPRTYPKIDLWQS